MTGVKLRGAPIGIEEELIWLTGSPRPCSSRSLTQLAASIPTPDSAPAKFPNPTSFSLNTSTSVIPFSCCHRAQSTASTPTVKMAAFVKAINAKIRSNKYTDYICSTRT